MVHMDGWMGEIMGLTSRFDTASDSEPTILDSHVPDIAISETRVIQSPLRFGGLTMDVRTGVTHWRGRVLELSLEERELMGILLRHAGQILSTERFARLLQTESRLVEVRMSALAARLKEVGVSCRPYKASGLGYVLWRS
jgi:DNA-binding response OmpR family regulator